MKRFKVFWKGKKFSQTPKNKSSTDPSPTAQDPHSPTWEISAKEIQTLLCENDVFWLQTITKEKFSFSLVNIKKKKKKSESLGHWEEVPRGIPWSPYSPVQNDWSGTLLILKKKREREKEIHFGFDSLLPPSLVLEAKSLENEGAQEKRLPEMMPMAMYMW